MKSCSWVLLSVACLLLWSADAKATTTTYGPTEDYKDSPGINNIEIPIHTRGRIFRWRFTDTIIIIIPTPSLPDLLGMLFVTQHDDDPDGPIVVTTMYGLDLNPGGPELAMGGFDPLSPEVQFVSGETFVGNSGIEYSSSSSYGGVPVSALAGLFPDFDLSALAGADPSSLVYPFSTTVPGSDFLVPEPGSIVLAAVGGLALCAIRRRRHV